MLVSDMPLQKRGIKDKKLHDEIYSKYMEIHLDLAMDVVQNMNDKWKDIERDLTSEW
jgi:AMP nucleosidase